MVKRNFWFAGMITFIVFTAGMLVQFNLDQARNKNVIDSIEELRLTTNSILAEKEIVSVFKDSECLTYKERIVKMVDDLTRLGNALETYRDRDIFLDESYSKLRQEYYILEIFYWSRLLQVKELCQDADFVTILYFFKSKEECSGCENQGVVLTDIKRRYGEDVQIFSLNYEMKYIEPTVNILVNKYNVTSTPFIVIDKNTTLEGFASKEVLENKMAMLLSGDVQ